MSKSIRIRTTPNGDDKYLKVKLEQDFDLLEILSLKLTQEEVYKEYCSSYGVVAGRVSVNNGFGIPNVKVSIFIPVTDEDRNDEVISRLYPYRSPSDRGENGVRYNLLPSKQQNVDHTPIGTFPDKREVLDDETYIEVYEKYYKYTTRTNESGDFMLYGVPVGDHTLHYDVDVSDIGFLSARPYELINQGVAKEKFQSEFKFKEGRNLDNLPQVRSGDLSVTVQPFWCDTLNDTNEVGVTRRDIPIDDYELIPTAIFMGSLYTDDENDSINKNCRPRRKTGDMNNLTTSSGGIEIIRRTPRGDIERYDELGEDLIDENGNWSFLMPMNLRKLITAEDGTLIPSPDGESGVASEADVRFRISMNPSGNEKRLRTRAKMLVPNMQGNYNFGEYKSEELQEAYDNNDPIFDINDEVSLAPQSYQDDVGNEYNYLKEFFTFRWKKVYTIRQYIGRYQKNSNDENRNFVGIKDIARSEGINKIPYNRVDTRISGLYSLLCTLLTFLYYLISFVNGLIATINGILTAICGIRIPCGICAVDLEGQRIRRVCKDGADCITGNITAVGPWSECVENVYDVTAPPVSCPSGSCHDGFYGVGQAYEVIDCEYDCDAVGGLSVLGKCWTFKYICLLGGLCNTETQTCCTTASDGCECNATDGCCDGCCEVIPYIIVTCDGVPYDIPPLFGVGECSNDEPLFCETACNGLRNEEIASAVQCQLTGLASTLGLIKLDFYNDWMNGSLYFPLIKRKYKVKKSKKKFGLIKKDKFCDFDCFENPDNPLVTPPNGYYLNSGSPPYDLSPNPNILNDDKIRKFDKEHGKPRYVEIDLPEVGFSRFINDRGHGHHQNKCNPAHLVERKEFLGKPYDLPDACIVSPPLGCDSLCNGGIKGCGQNFDSGYNENTVKNGIIKWYNGEIYYASVINDQLIEPSSGSVPLKNKLLYPTNITELGSTSLCDIDDAPFIMDKLENTTYRVSETLEGDNVNYKPFADIGCLRIDCLNVRNVALSSQLGVDLIDYDDNDGYLNNCQSLYDHGEEIREYICSRFTTYKNNNLDINYKLPSISSNNNIYQFFETNTTPNNGNNTVNDGDGITTNDWCKMVNFDDTEYQYFYGMNDPQGNYNPILEYGNNAGVLNNNASVSFNTMHTPFYFYFGVVPGKTALEKTVSKYFADKVNDSTALGIVDSGEDNDDLIIPPDVNEESPASILGNCLNR